MSLRTKGVILLVLLAAVEGGLALTLWLVFESSTAAVVLAGAGVLVLFLFWIQQRMFRSETGRVLQQLSDLLEALIDLREIDTVSTLGDDLFSKLQMQTLKLTGILRAHNQQIAQERDNIQQLISDIAHQLKTPLANLQLYASFLLDEGLSPNERREFSGNICIQLDKLTWLMENLIKLSRLESGVIQLTPRRTSVNSVILSALHQCCQKAQDKGIAVEFFPQGEVVALLDEKWTAEALFNLLDNAVKYTQPGGRIAVRVEAYEIYLRIDIEDTGSGVSEEEIPRLFQRFYRGSNAREEEGVGVGLYLTREIVSRQDGYIKVESKLGKGSRFSVFLPLAAQD